VDEPTATLGFSQQFKCCHYHWFHLLGGEKEMAAASAIAATKAGDRIKLVAESLSNGALGPFSGLAEDYTADRRSL